MPNKPAARILIDEHLIRGLLTTQATNIDGVGTLSLRHADDSWDCSI